MRIRYTWAGQPTEVNPRMNTIRARNFFVIRVSAGLLIAILLAATIPSLFAQKTPKSGQQIEQVLQDAVNQKGFPGIVAAVWRADKLVYQGAAGKQDSDKNVPMSMDSIFNIASMTKPITSVAVMQLVESGHVKLDEPVASYLPELSQLQVLEAFDSTTKQAKLRPPKTPPTVRQLLTHTSGFVYDFFDQKLHDYAASGAVPSAARGDDRYLKAPLMFDPGTQWEYGINTDWLGKLVEKVSGQNLEDYFRQHIFEPLGMKDTFFNVPEEKQARMVATYQRQGDGSLRQLPSRPFTPVRFFSGGGGLYSTVGDYVKFMRMILNGGKLGNARILKSETVALMARNQLGDLSLSELKSLAPQLAADPIRVPGSLDKFGLGFGINSKPVEGGRSAGSLAWAGIFNTYFWIDPSQKTCAVFMTQSLPFSDPATIALFEQFERAVYTEK